MIADLIDSVQGEPQDFAGTNPREGLGFEADMDTEIKALDGTRWVKVGEGNNDWEKIMVSENGEFVANIELEDISGTVPPVGVLGRVGSSLRMGDGETNGGIPVGSITRISPTNQYAPFALGMIQEEFPLAIRFTFTKTTAIAGYIAVGGGATHVKFLRWDGTYHTVRKAVTGTVSFSAADWGVAPASPYNSRFPKFGAIVPCSSDGTANGFITKFGSTNNQISSIDVSNLNELQELILGGNQLTNLDLTGLFLITKLHVYNNLLDSLDFKDCRLLADFEGHQSLFTNLDFSGLTELTNIRVDKNNLDFINISDLGTTELSLAITEQYGAAVQQGPTIKANNTSISTTFNGVLLQYGLYTIDKLEKFFFELLTGTATIHVYGTPALLHPDWENVKSIATDKGYTVSVIEVLGA